MQMDWILGPAGQYSLLALVLIGCLALFVSTRVQIGLARRSFHERCESARQAADTTVAALRTELASLRKEMESAPANLPGGQELNLTRRAQALRMQHRGEGATTIAATLRVPRNEIDLLLKIQQLPELRSGAVAPGK